jgi:hypothetical protein
MGGEGRGQTASTLQVIKWFFTLTPTPPPSPTTLFRLKKEHAGHPVVEGIIRVEGAIDRVKGGFN